MCRIARDAGDVSALFPEGITKLADLPYTIFNAIQEGLFYASFDELLPEERPRKAIWGNEKLMEQHWREVERVREERMRGNDTSGMAENQLAKELIVGRG